MHRIPLRMKLRFFRSAGCGHDAVGEESAVAAEEHDVAFAGRAGIDVLDHERISRPDGGQHAPAHDPQPQGPRRAQNLGRQFALDDMCIAERLRRRIHEAFGLPMQFDDMLPTFPHDRAVVTNTCSKRKDGFSYGFLVARVRGVSEEVSFIAIGRTCLSILIECRLSGLHRAATRARCSTSLIAQSCEVYLRRTGDGA